MNIEIANRLLKYRKKSGFSQEELSEKIGVSRQAVSKWERSEASPDTDNLIILAEIYGVTLDQLLKEDPADDIEESAEEEQVEDTSEQTVEDNTEENSQKVSFKNGIHVNDKGDKVDIGWNGIHVYSKNGDKVDIDKNGINVTEASGEPLVYTDEDGRVHRSDKYSKPEKSKAHKFWEKFPYWFIAIAGFFLFGSMGIMGGYATSWMWFLTIPLYYTTVEAIFKRSLNVFCYPVLVVMIFLWAGFFFGLWHPAWIMFLTIPIFYWIASFFSEKEDCHKVCDNPEENPENKKRGSVIAVIVGIIVGVIVLNAVLAGSIYLFSDEKVTNEVYRINEKYSDNIYIDKSSGELNILHSDKNYSYINYKSVMRGVARSKSGLKISESGNTTKISDGINGFMFFGVNESIIDVYLTDKEYDSLTIETSSGNTNFDGNTEPFIINTLKLDSSSGSVNVTGVKCKSVIADTSSGSVNIEGAFNEANLDTSSGNVTLTDYCHLDRFYADTSSGNITLNIPDDEEGFTLDYDTSSGEIKSDFSVVGTFDVGEDTVTYGKGEGKYEIEMSSGNFKLYKNPRAKQIAMKLIYEG